MTKRTTKLLYYRVVTCTGYPWLLSVNQLQYIGDAKLETVATKSQ